MNDKEVVRGALARGYCTERNSHKVLDPDLIEDMAVEVDKLAISAIEENERLREVCREVIKADEGILSDEESWNWAMEEMTEEVNESLGKVLTTIKKLKAVLARPDVKEV